MNESTGEPRNGGISYRLADHAERLRNLELRTANVNVHDREIAALWTAVNRVGDEVSSLRRALYTAALSFAGGSLLVAVTIFEVFR